MQGGQQIKGKRVAAKRTSRLPAREDRTPATFNYQDNCSNFLITVNVVQPHKSSDKPHGKNEQKIKKLKFITEDIEKSTQDMLEVRSHSHQKQRSLKHDSQNIEDQHAYQICRVGKKSQKSHQDDRRNQHKDNQKDHFPLGNLKTRKPKHHSKDHPRINPIEAIKKPSRSNKKLNPNPKTTRETREEQQRQYLSPDLVQLENSYYFSNNQEQAECSSRSEQKELLHEAAGGAVRRERKYIFQSNQNVWQEKPSKAVANSVLNPLSDY